MKVVSQKRLVCSFRISLDPGPLNITFGSDMPITFFISEFTT